MPQRLGIFGGAAALLLGAGCASAAEDKDTLVELVNAFRTTPHKCEGRKREAAGPLAPSAALSRAQVDGGDLQGALARVDYAAADAQLIVVSGPRNARAAMGVLAERYCSALSSPDFAEIGVAREGRTWRVLLARPLIARDLGDPREAGKQVLALVNAARRAPRNCGERRFGTAPALGWDDTLAQTALAHSRDMARKSYFAHADPSGTTVKDRATRHGYAWRRIGENIATGQGSPERVVAGWLASPHHCVNIMEPAYTEMGAAYDVNLGTATKIYWTQVFGTPAR